MNLATTLNTTLLPVLTVFLLAACGGGSSGESSSQGSGGIQLISFTDLPLSVSAEEGATVDLSLDASGDGSESLSYDWDVTLNNENLSFTGQGSDTISFVAPEVDQLSVVSVRVQVSSSSIDLVGQDSFRTSVNVSNLDLSPSVNEYEVGMTTTLPEVDAVDLLGINPSSTWLVRQYIKQNISVDDIDTTISTVSREIFHVTNSSVENTLNVSFCGIQDSFAIDVTDYDSRIVCESGNTDTKFYQEDKHFRNEFICDGEVLSATDFIFISDESRTDFGELEITFDTYASLETTNNVCGSTVVANVSQEATASQPAIELNSSSITLLSEYQNQSIELVLSLDDSNFSSFYLLDEIFNSLELVSVAITSDGLPTISGITNNYSGRISFFSSSATNLEGSFRIDTIDTNLSDEEIEADFSLSFE